MSAKDKNTIMLMYETGASYEDIIELGIKDYEILMFLYNKYKNTKSPFYRNEYLKNYIQLQLEEEPFLLLSDTHYGSRKEYLPYINYAIEEAKRRGIYTVFNCGDFTDGLVRPHPLYDTEYKQIDHALNRYPENPGIKHYMVLGNHDTKYQEKGANLIKIVEKERKDIRILGSDTSYIKIGGESIAVSHQKNKYRMFFKTVHPKLYLYGHSHQLKKETKDNINYIAAGTLSNEHPNGIQGQEDYPGFYIVTPQNNTYFLEAYQFINGQIKKDKVKTLTLNERKPEKFTKTPTSDMM